MAKTATLNSPETKVDTTPAPYLAFLTFTSSLAALEPGIPKTLDRTVWPSQSGLVQGQILMAYRFLDLVDDQDHPTDLLHELVSAKDRVPIIVKMLNQSYRALLDHDLTKMTPKNVEDEMERYNVTGETKRKAVTFFLRAAKFGGLPMHPLLSAMVRNTGPRKKRTSRKGLYIGDMSGKADSAYEPTPTTRNTKTIRLSRGGTVSLSISADPFTLPSEDRQFIFDLVDKLQAYEQAHPSVDQEEEEGQEQER